MVHADSCCNRLHAKLRRVQSYIIYILYIYILYIYIYTASELEAWYDIAYHGLEHVIYILIRYWTVRSLRLSLCPFAIETTFPLSNLKTKHIFGILISLQKLLKLWGAPIFFSPSFTDAEGGAKWPPGAPYRREKSRRRRVFREYDHMEVKIGNIFIV